ncbi:protocadherin alpha-8-like isoform X26 [Archocentrus centrarchus]|uniref:protocadherin alpha-8-like isoform X26 n=1 Tax=Archocentrus centrarchus TaxID=63155 RepID=UPI0011EA4DF8|nr:protocadherin alpha-8-like isoform X26 [Archocentrus centrarchus]
MARRGRGALLERLVIFIVSLALILNSSSAQLRYSIPEELTVGSVVGNVAKDLGLDHTALHARGFRIVSGSTEPLFQLNNNGILHVNRKIDREEVCERIATCILNIKTVLENPLEVHYVGIEVLDANDHSPTFSINETHLEISESALPGARFQLQGARDPDSDMFSIQQYKLSQNDHFRLEVKDREEDGKIPVLFLHKALDKEAARIHRLLLTAVDGGKPARSGTMEITVNVLDVNDNMPVFARETYTAVLDENSPIGTTIIQVNATDLDDGLNGEVIYSFGNNVNDKLRQLFEVDSSTGEIFVKGLIDFEAKDRYQIDIKASDKGPVPLATEKSVKITIVDLNDNTPEIEVTSFSSAVPEDSKPGTTVALISVNDKDSGVNGKVICSVSQDVPFTLTPSLQENMYSLVTKSLLDREHQSKYHVTIVAKDAGEQPLSSHRSITVTISDVNDNSPEFSTNPYIFYVTENNSAGGSLFSVSAHDDDDRDNARISYNIVRRGYEKLTSFLNINSENGEIVALTSFDFETLKMFQFQVVATDSGTPSLCNNVTVNVFILDQNDNAPVILYPLSSNGSAEGVEEIPRNVNAGHLVTKVRAYDADIGYNGWLLFSLQQVTDHSLFGLDRYTGQIRTLRSFTETDEAEHKLVILVKDNGNVSLSATATVIVKLVEPKEAFAASDVKSATKDDEDNNVTLYLMITLGSVSVLFLVSVVVLIAMQCSKSTDYSSKYLPETNYDGTLCHSIQYRSGEKRYMLVGPRMSIGSTIVPGSHANTLVLPDRRRTSEEPKAPNSDWRYSASLRAGGVMQSSVHMEESSVMQGAQGVLVQNWPTASSAADGEGGEVSPPMGAGVDSNSWHFRYGPGGPGAPPQHLKPGEVPPEAFIIPGSPAIISIRQNQGGEDDKSDFITFGKKEEAKKKKKKKKEKKDKKDKGKDDGDE